MTDSRIKYKNTRTQEKDVRPNPSTQLLDGEISLNTHSESPALFFRTADTQSLVKIGPTHVSETPPQPKGHNRFCKGEMWFDTTTSQLKVWVGDGEGWKPNVFIPPTSSAGLPSGSVWNDGGTLTVVP